jgi:glycerophosphoryl diester phosphodiesterase
MVIAHRGASGHHFENSLPAFRAAIDEGADGIELDVHATSDNSIVVHHDADLPGYGPIASISASKVAEARLPTGKPIPLLAEVLDLADSLAIYVEVKHLADTADEALLGVLDAGPATDRYQVHSFDHRIIARLGRLRPRLGRGILLCSRPVDLAPLVDSTGATTVWQERQFVDETLLSETHRLGVDLIAWTVNQDVEIERMLQLGVTGICGDYPDRLRAMVDAHG